MRHLFARIPPESRVAAVVLGLALVQVGLLAWLGLRATDQRRVELEGELRDGARRAQATVVGAGVSRVATLEQAAHIEVERAGRPLAVRIRDALSRAPLFTAGYVVTGAPGGAVRLEDAAHPSLAAEPPTPRDEPARRAVAALVAAEAGDPERVVAGAERVADGTTDRVAAALALESGWRAALRLGDDARALELASRVLRESAAVVDDRDGSDGAPFGASAAAAVCEVRRRAVQTAGFEHAAAFASALIERRQLAQRLRDVLGPAAYEAERADCAALVEGVSQRIPAQRTNALRTFLRACDAEDAALAAARAADPAGLAAAVARREPARLTGADAMLVVLPLAADAEAGDGAAAVAFVAPFEALRREALRALDGPQAVPAGVELVPVDDAGTPLTEAVLGRELAEPRSFGAVVPGLRIAAVLADPRVLEDQTSAERRLWLWILAASLLAVVAASLLAARTVLREVRLARLKGDFVSNLSHELRTPLTSLRMFVETLQEGRVRDESERRQCLDFIAQETDRLATLVDRVLQFAAFSRGRAPIDLRVADPASVAHRALEIFETRAARANARVECVVADPLPEALLDRDALIQVILNLLDNAVKYGREDGARVRVTVRGDGARVVFEVEDDGPGVPERERELVFEEFYRGDESLSSSVQGAGIGLALCRRIVLGHGGRIEAGRSRDLGGAAFRVTLPEAAAGRRIAVAVREERS